MVFREKTTVKSLKEMLNEGTVAAEDVPAIAQQAAAELQAEIIKLVPKHFQVSVRYSQGLGRSISVHVVDVRKESIKVTWHNSENVIHFMMHLSDNFGRSGAVAKVAWERLASHDQKLFPFRKITANSIEDASKKLVAWFKKNKSKIAEAPAEYENPNFFGRK